MNRDSVPGWLPGEVNTLHQDILEHWGAGWKTDLLQRLMLPHMRAAWVEILKRGSKHESEHFDETRSPYIYALCWEFLGIREDAMKAHRTPTENAERYQDIANVAARLAGAIDGTRLDRVADNDIQTKPGTPTPTFGTLLLKLSTEAEELAHSAVSKTNILPRPGGKHATRIYVIRRLAIVLDEYFGDKLYGTTADFAAAILDEVVQVEHVNNALRNWAPESYDERGEYN